MKARPMAEIRDRLPKLLEEGRKRLVFWSENPSLLEPAAKAR